MDAERATDAMTDSALDGELQAALSVEPSPELLARVRTRIANEPAPSAWRLPWVFAAAGAMAAVVAVSFVLSRPQVPASQPVESGKAAADRTLPAEPALRPALPERSGSPERLALQKPAPQAREPEILIDVREGVALRGLIAGVSNGRVDLAPLLNLTPQAPTDLAPIEAIVIPPITIEPLAPSSGAQGERQ